jgi:tRNA(adenine34) deaminase
MDAALTCAQQALAAGEVPIGAVVVDKNNVIIGTGFNQVEQGSCQTLHAELVAIREAAKTLGTWRLDDCWLYVTLEPCLMCLGAIGLSRLAGVAFGAASPDFGSLKMLTIGEHPVYFKRLIVLRGLKENECVGMLRLFFKRARGKEYSESTHSLSGKDQIDS